MGPWICVALWPAVRLLADPQGTLDWREALARDAAFTAPTGPDSNLGIRRESVWVRLDIRVIDGATTLVCTEG